MVESPPPMFCSKCGAKISATGRFCPSCGEAVDTDSGATILGDEASLEGATIGPSSPAPRKTPPPHFSPRTPRTPSGSNPASSSDPIGGGRFTPRQIIAQRYRVVALAGRGGMGEGYRAQDVTLGQVVALKFLPEALTQDAAALARFHAEVRTARQVSHPNVCRVFDIGEADGTLFLTMEYVDGEDLASVVRRIGRLSPDKATEIARQICAGLAAAHERGVIHRDLKPANVMLDGAGKIRITDFGLAGIAATIQGAEVRAGTPAYMAPEQLAGREVSASKLLRCHIGWRARADFRSLDGRGDAGESKVGDANLSGSIEHDVCRLQVAMDHAAFVCRRKTCANLPRDLRGLIRRKPADSADDRGEIFSIDILHRQKKGSIGFADVKHAANVGMRDLPGSSHFGMKSCQRSGILSKLFRQKLQRHDLTER